MAASPDRWLIIQRINGVLRMRPAQQCSAGERPPTEPPTAKKYTEAGLPWFDYYGGDVEAVEGAEKFKGLIGVAAMGKRKGATPLPENESVDVERIIALRKKGSERVREMTTA